MLAHHNPWQGPFSDVVNSAVKDPWLKTFLDLECFVLRCALLTLLLSLLLLLLLLLLLYCCCYCF